jgi:YVTN family beta-propeller protein
MTLLICLLTVTLAEPGDYVVYVSNERSGDVSVIDPKSNEVVETIPVGKRPRGIGVSRDGKLVYVALSGSPITPPGQPDPPAG